MPFTVSHARQANDHVRVMEAGFDEHLVKPLRAGKLGPLIEKLVATQGDTVRRIKIDGASRRAMPALHGRQVGRTPSADGPPMGGQRRCVGSSRDA